MPTATDTTVRVLYGCFAWLASQKGRFVLNMGFPVKSLSSRSTIRCYETVEQVVFMQPQVDKKAEEEK